MPSSPSATAAGSDEPARVGPRRRRALAVSWAASFALFALLASRHIDFPVYWHANSGGQAVEVQKGHHNFRQPLLLVTATQAVVALRPGEETKQEIAVAGRWVAVVFGGLSVVALAALAARLAGPLAGMVAGPILALASPLVFWAHFFKEDTALLLGLSLSFLALAVFWQERTRRAVVGLGLACGLAFAGKYVGILATVFALPLVVAAGAGARRRLRVFGLAWLAAFVIANHPMLGDLGGFFEGLGYEIGHVGEAFTDKGYVQSLPANPWPRYRSALAQNVVAPVQALALLYLLLLPFPGRRRTAPEWAWLAFGILFFVLVTRSVLQTPRHFLPVWTWIHVLGALGLCDLAGHLAPRLGGRRATAVALAGLVLVLPFEIHRTLDRNADFERSSRARLRRFVREVLPADARIAADWHAGLPDPHARHHDWPQPWLAQEIRTATEVADLGSLRELLEDGFTHVVLVPTDRGDDEPLPVERLRHERRVRFHRELERHGERIFDSRDDLGADGPTDSFNGRHVQVVRLPPPSVLGPRAPSLAERLAEAAARGEIRPEPRHVVLLVVESLRADHVGAHGYGRATTPELDDLAARSTRFARAMAVESAGRASAASLLTGTPLARHRLRYRSPQPDTLRGGASTLAEILSALGWYAVAAVSGPAWAPETGLAAGFVRYEHDAGASGVAALDDLLAKRPPGRPLLLLLELGDVGLPYEAPPPWDAAFSVDLGDARPDRIARGRYRPEDAPAARAAYDREVRHADAQLGAVLARLSAAGLDAGNTVFVVTALHGQEFFERHPADPGGTGSGRTLFDEQIHVPLVVSVPGLSEPRVVSEPVSLLDVAPTLLEALGIPAADAFGPSGRSLWPALAGEGLLERAVHAGGIHGRAAWLDGGWKYLRYSRRTRRVPGLVENRREDGHFYGESLFHLDDDPAETRNLAAAEPERLSLLRSRLEAWEEAAAPAPLPFPGPLPR